jgi:hypothetical protein
VHSTCSVIPYPLRQHISSPSSNALDSPTPSLSCRKLSCCRTQLNRRTISPHIHPTLPERRLHAPRGRQGDWESHARCAGSHSTRQSRISPYPPFKLSQFLDNMGESAIGSQAIFLLHSRHLRPHLRRRRHNLYGHTDGMPHPARAVLGVHMSRIM